MKLPRVTFSYGRRLEPARDWSILLTIAIVSLVISVGWNVWLFERVSSGEALGSSSSSLPSSFTQTELKKLASIFEDRAAEAQKYEEGTYRFIDPSK